MWVFVLFFAQYEIVEMMLSLTMLLLLNFYRLFTRRFIGSICGPISSLRTNRCIWILDALAWWWSFGLSSTKMVDSVLIEYKMLSVILYSFFRWLIHVATLGDLWWLVNLMQTWFKDGCYFRLINGCVCIIARKSQFRKKKRSMSIHVDPSTLNLLW
jgi:hypothetical protein